MQENTILKIEHVSKFYPGVTALKDVSFTLQKGEVRALVGENGAGKSTLIKCIMGVEKPDEGKITMNYNGEWVVNATAVDAQAHGVFANYQHVNIAPDLSIAENYFLGRQPKTKLGLVDWKKMARDSKKIIDKFEMGVDPLAKIRELPIAMQAMVTISKISVNEDIRLVIFDEPTALLENEKVDMLFRFIGELKSQGVSIIYISHRLEEIMQICDSVTILKDGSYVDTMPIENVTKDSLIQMMVGRPATDIYNIRHFDTDEELLRVENFSDSKHFKNINFTLHKGEILGFAGLMGAGRTELARAIFGADPFDSGEIYINGKKTKIKSPESAVKHGICYLSEDRKRYGLLLIKSVSENSVLASLDDYIKFGWIRDSAAKQAAEEANAKLRTKTPSMDQLLKNLSGGNQQKVIVARWLLKNSDIFIFDEPTRGIDVGAKSEMYDLMEDLAAQGKSIIMISSELSEIQRLSDRVIVMCEGNMTADLSIEGLTQEEIMKYATMRHPA